MQKIKRSFVESHLSSLPTIPVSWAVPQDYYYQLSMRMCQLQTLAFEFAWSDNSPTVRTQRTELVQPSKVLSLDVSLNELQSLDHEGLLPLHDLRTLDVSLNRLDRIVGVEVLPNLRVLNVSHNFLRFLHGLEQSHHLTELNAAVNELQDISYLPSLPNLTVLHINNNKLNSLNGIQILTHLRELYSQKNYVGDIVPVSGCLRLQVLDVSHNNIKSLYSTVQVIRDLHKLTAVNLHGNPVEKEPGYQGSLLAIDHLLTLDNVSLKPTSQDHKLGKGLYTTGSNLDHLKATARQAFTARLSEQRQKMQETTRFLQQRILSVQHEYGEYEAKMKQDLEACLGYLDGLSIAEQKIYDFDLLRQTIGTPEPKPWQMKNTDPRAPQQSSKDKNVKDTDEVLRLAFNKLAKEQERLNSA